MRALTLSVFIFSIMALPASLQADEKDKDVDRLAMYRVYHGKWESVTTTRVTSGEEPVEFETKGTWAQREILEGAMIEVKGVGEMDGKPYRYMLLYGYDQPNRRYVSWFHDQNGVHAKLLGTWSEQEKTMAWTNAEENPDGSTVSIVDDLSERDRITFRLKVEAEDGATLMTQSGVATRSKED